MKAVESASQSSTHVLHNINGMDDGNGGKMRAETKT